MMDKLFNIQLNGKGERIFAYGLCGLMLFMSTLDMALDWGNYCDLASSKYQQGLIVGSPTSSSLAALLVFNIFGTLMWILEVLNCLTMLCNHGHVRMPIQYEQILVLLLEEIPMAGTNLGIVACRLHTFTPLQVWTTVSAILNTATRLYLYGGCLAREYGFSKENTFKTTLKLAVYITVTMMWFTMFIMQCFLWAKGGMLDSKGATIKPDTHWLYGVSVVLLKAPYLEGNRFKNKSIDVYLDLQGTPLDHPWLVEDLKLIMDAGESGYTAEYTCPSNTSLRSPSQCQPGVKLKFKFHYEPHPEKYEHSISLPYGIIYYDYAVMTGNSCKDATAPLDADFKLFYFKVMVMHPIVRNNERNRVWNRQKHDLVFVQSPWPVGCVAPYPSWDKNINLCSY